MILMMWCLKSIRLPQKGKEKYFMYIKIIYNEVKCIINFEFKA